MTDKLLESRKLDYEKELYEKYVQLDEIHDLLEKYRKDFVRGIRGNKEFYDLAIGFARKIENVLSWYQLEMMSLTLALNNEIKTQKLLIKIMEAYGIDPSEALMPSKIRITQGLNGFYIPEKLIPYFDHDYAHRVTMKQERDKLKSMFPNFSDKIDELYKEKI